MLLTALSSSSKIQPEDKRNMALLLVFPLLLCATLQGTRAATITVENKCGYPVWAAALPGGGQQLMPQAQPWTFDLVVGTKAARIWGRTGCTFDAEGRGSCQTGDCAGQLSCTVSGAVPSSLAEITLNGNDAKNTDFYDISLVDGFNVPLSIYPSSPGCPTVNCNKDINSLCPEQLKVPGGCTSACNKFQQPQYCCTGSFTDNCAPTGYSRFFKDQCPQAYSYAKDDTSSTFTCPSGGNYRISFCG